MAVKAKVEKLLKVDFIYPMALTEWVSNPVLVDKKQGTIHNCTDFIDLNKAYPKDNYPLPFIDQIIDACVRSEVFSFIYGFSRYNQIQIKLEDKHKIAFICPWGTFAYKKFLLDWKMQGIPFNGQWIFPPMTSILLSNPT